MNGSRIRVYCGASPEKGEARVALTEHPNTLQLTERLRKIEGAAVLGDHQGTGREKRSGAKKGEDAPVFVAGGIGGIEENDVERRVCRSVFRGETLQAPQGVELENPCATANTERIDILLNESGSGRMVFDEYGFCCTTTQRFDADGASAGEHVEEAASGDASSEDIEECLAEAVGGGAKSKALEAFELAAAECSGDDTHGVFDGPQPTRAR